MDISKEKRNNKVVIDHLLYSLMAPINVGGQAVIEGVMMRSPKAMSIAVRRPDGEVIVKKKKWVSLSERIPILQWPFFRGSLVLIEAMLNGIEALNFSAKQQEESPQESDQSNNSSSNISTYLTIALAISLALLLFVVIPHVASRVLLILLGSKAGLGSITFNLIDASIKLFLFLGYIALIGCIPDIKRVFAYHGAEHRSIYTFESGEELTVANAQQHSTLHPRCGTSFIIVVLMVSIVIFAVTFQYIQLSNIHPIIRGILAILIKLGLMIPIAGISYEIIRFAGSPIGKWASFLVAPGLLVQKLTTRIPTDDQMEVAICALKAALEMESSISQKTSD